MAAFELKYLLQHFRRLNGVVRDQDHQLNGYVTIMRRRFTAPLEDVLNWPLVGERLTVGSCENGISDSIPILILENHRFQNFWKGTHVKIESE